MKKYLLFILVYLVFSFTSDAQETKPPSLPAEASAKAGQDSLEQILAKKFSAGFKKVEVREFLRMLQNIGPLNIVLSKAVTGDLTFVLENVTIGEALEVTLITNSLAKEIRGNIIHIMTETEYQALYGKPYNTRLAVKTFQLQHTLPKLVGLFLADIRSRNGSLLPDDGTRNLLIIDVPEKIQEMEEVIKRLDVPAETETFELKNASIDDILPEVNKLLTVNYGDVKTDKRMKRFIVTDHPQVLEKVAYLVKRFDAKPRQVLIEAKIIQITLKDEFAMGIDWTQVFSHASAFKDVKLVGRFPIKGDAGQKINLTATVGTIPKTHYEIILKALKAFGENKVVSAPRIITLADKEAMFKVTKEEPYYEGSETINPQTGQSTKVYTPKIKDIGPTLTVTPSINEDKYISMVIKPEITEFIDYAPTPMGDRYPIVQKATTTTNVMVKDGVTIVIAGLLKEEKQKISEGIPFLSQLPLIGPLFSSKREYVARTETVIFLTPYIVTGDFDTSVLSKDSEMERKEPKGLKPLR
jgi:type II secretory pathway component GspD/PulD (secretin)